MSRTAARTAAAAQADPRDPGRRLVSLRGVIWFKIVITLAAWAVPLLLAPPWLFERIGFPPRPEPMVFERLLGAAFLALTVGYVRGLRAHTAGYCAKHAVAVGIVSNGLASLVLLRYGLAGGYAAFGWGAQAFLWGSAAATALVTLGLAATRAEASPTR